MLLTADLQRTPGGVDVEIGEHRRRIDGPVILAHFEVQMRPGGETAFPDGADHLSGGDAVPGLDGNAVQMRIQCLPRAGFDDDRGCLLYTSDAADEEDSVDLGGRRQNLGGGSPCRSLEGLRVGGNDG